MRYQFVQQQSQEDCGAACLATIAKHHGRTFALNRVREAIGTGSQGSNLLGIRRGAEKLGFQARHVQANPSVLDNMQEVPLPAIIHWKGYHYVVLYGQKGNRKGKQYVIADPAVGIRYVTRSELAANWSNGFMLVLQPEPDRFLQQAEDKLSGFGRFLKRSMPYHKILFESFLINLVLGGLSLASPILIQILTDDVLIRGDAHLLRGLAIAIITMNVVSSALGLAQAHLIAQFAQRLELGLVMEFGRKLLRLPLSYYEARRSGEVVSRLQDIQQINQLVSQVAVQLPSQFFIALISVGLMLFYTWKLTLLVLVIAICTTLSTLIFLPVLQQKVRSILVLDAENQGFLVETFKGALALKTMVAHQQIWDELQSRFSRLARLVYSTTQIGIFNGSFSGLASSVGSVLLLWYGSSLVINRELSIGQLLAFNSMNGNFLMFIGSLIGFVNQLMQVKTATQRLTEVIDAQAEMTESETKAIVQIRPDDDITCANVSFHHLGRLNLLKEFSLVIPGSQVTALVGRSGCGKSSLVKLIAGLYPYQDGNIRVGAFNLADLALDCLRRQVVLVPQEAQFWSRSIVENLMMGSPHLTFEQIVRACQVAGADEFISQLPEKYQTVLGEFGANLSGGQKQRLAIARAVAVAPPILILDEATAGLDPMSEAELLDRLLRLRQGQTTILISHRPRVIQRADWVVLLEQGQVQMQGTPEELGKVPGEHLRFLVA